jgi:tetratricopeptide (TPR) repeat protein
MDADAFLDEIERQWPQPGQSPSKEIAELCQAAVNEHPESSTLWYDLGIIMQRCGDECGFRPEDYLRCFENAVRCNAGNGEAQQELGNVLDTFFDDYARAERAFQKAIESGAGAESYSGLARTLAQVGKIDEALQLLSEPACPFHDDPEVQKMRTEIAAGDWYWSKAEDASDA